MGLRTLLKDLNNKGLKCKVLMNFYTYELYKTSPYTFD